MASPNSTYSNDVLATTAQLLEDVLFDEIKTKNALTALLEKYDAIEYKDGGPTIVIPIMFAENGSYKRYSGADQLNTSSNDVFSVFQASWCQIALNVQANGRELLINSGRSQNKDLLKSRFMNAKTTFANEFNIDLLSDGTATNQITGLQAQISADGTGTIQGIARASYSFAKNQFRRCTTDGGAAMSAATIVPNMDVLDTSIAAYRGNTKAILSDNTSFQYYEQTVHPLQRLNKSDGDLGKLGFKTYAYKQAEVVFEPTVSGMPASTQYWIDPEVIALIVHEKRDLVQLDTRNSFNQDAQISYLAWMGQLVGKNYRRLGTLNNN